MFCPVHPSLLTKKKFLINGDNSTLQAKDFPMTCATLLAMWINRYNYFTHANVYYYESSEDFLSVCVIFTLATATFVTFPNSM